MMFRSPGLCLSAKGKQKSALIVGVGKEQNSNEKKTTDTYCMALKTYLD
jgi:hypothetical protein